MTSAPSGGGGAASAAGMRALTITASTGCQHPQAFLLSQVRGGGNTGVDLNSTTLTGIDVSRAQAVRPVEEPCSMADRTLGTC
jgi:hypothetical protein